MNANNSGKIALSGRMTIVALPIALALGIGVAYPQCSLAAKSARMPAVDSTSADSSTKGALSAASNVDDKITGEEKQKYAADVARGDKYASQQAKVINRIPGA